MALLLLTAVAWNTVPRWKPPLVIPEDGGVAGWPAYGGDAGGSRYSPLKQITPENVMHLEVAWTHRTGEDYTGTDSAWQAAYESTPILIGTTLYLTTPSSRVIALDAESGAEKWVFDPKVTPGKTSELTNRGCSSWQAPDGAHRIFVAALDARLIALDAATGQKIAGFGTDGEINLREGVAPLDGRDYVMTSPPAIIHDTVVVGSAIGDNRKTDSERGVVRAYDALTGALKWSFDPIPVSPADPAFADWEPGQAQKTGAANVWSIMSVDAERDLLFVPTGSASPDYYGGERKGDNRYANCVVALRGTTGEVVWHFQVVHHDLWDYDVPAQPVLATVAKAGQAIPVRISTPDHCLPAMVATDGQAIPAVVQATKMGHVFFLHRETGVPIFPVEERPVPQSDVPGEASSPTQPFPVVTPPLVPQTLGPEEAWGLTYIDKKWNSEKIATLRSEGIFTPPSLQGSVHFPGVAGGTNWGSVAIDPENHLAIMNTTRAAFQIALAPRSDFEQEGALDGVERGKQLGTPYGMHRQPLLSALGLPVSRPPWGTLAAVSTETGELVWESVLGTIRDLAPIPLPIRWGTPNMGGPIVTAGGLIFIAATMDDYLRAFDAKSGKELWKGRLPAGGQATPMTYRLSESGKQYVVIVAGGHGRMGTRLGDYVVAFALPGTV
ncbi:MAG: pyrroloquinoline quinone-dependent dehydrogenase [Candidatus Hydrogenedentes bacterium]|nr:pyrroloquinoline quinone-dependent dehydrogenase [Candidatus Hydrogenedentota bacterium]